MDFGQPTTQTGVRSLTAQVVTDGVVDLPQKFPTDSSSNVSRPASSAQRYEWKNATSTKVGHRQIIKFGLSDGQQTFSAAPKITLQGVKLRRVIMRCEEV